MRQEQKMENILLAKHSHKNICLASFFVCLFVWSCETFVLRGTTVVVYSMGHLKNKTGLSTFSLLKNQESPILGTAKMVGKVIILAFALRVSNKHNV